MRPVLEDPVFNKAVAWWYVKPEELRPWKFKELEYLSAVRRAIREIDPLERPIWMYEPNHRTASKLAITGTHLNVIGKGSYVNTGKTNAEGVTNIPHVWLRWSIEQQIEAKHLIDKSERTDKLPRTSIAVLEMSQDLEPSSDANRIRQLVRHDVYLSLVSGAKGVAVWSAARHPEFDSHEHFLEAYLSCFRELTGPEDLAAVLLSGEPTKTFELSVIEGPESLSLSVRLSREEVSHLEYSSVANLELTFGNHRYLFLVNSVEEQAKVIVSGSSAVDGTALEIFTREEMKSDVGRFTTLLPPLGVQVWKFE